MGWKISLRASACVRTLDSIKWLAMSLQDFWASPLSCFSSKVSQNLLVPMINSQSLLQSSWQTSSWVVRPALGSATKKTDTFYWKHGETNDHQRTPVMTKSLVFREWTTVTLKSPKKHWWTCVKSRPTLAWAPKPFFSFSLWVQISDRMDFVSSLISMWELWMGWKQTRSHIVFVYQPCCSCKTDPCWCSYWEWFSTCNVPLPSEIIGASQALLNKVSVGKGHPSSWNWRKTDGWSWHNLSAKRRNGFVHTHKLVTEPLTVWWLL